MYAYLIIAHNNFGILKKLICMLDYAGNDIFIHIDKKVGDFDFEYYRKLAKYSMVYFTDRVHISWGDYSMIEAEYILLKNALNKNRGYNYYHLLSGVDLPLKSADELNLFFDSEYPKEFIHFAGRINSIELSRIKHYHFFTGRRNWFNRIFTKAEQLFQSAVKIDRTKNLVVARGSQWFSITDKFAEFLVNNEDKICRQLKHTFIPDEFFVQLAAVNSSFADNLYYGGFDDSCRQNMRYIDWQRGSPYTFEEADFDEIMNSGCLFVRKLSEENELTDRIYREVMK